MLENVGHGQLALEWLRPHRDLAINLYEACIDAKAAIGPHRGNLEQVVDAQLASDVAEALWRPLKADDESRERTSRPRTMPRLRMISSVRPSAKSASLASAVRLVSGRTAICGRSTPAGALSLETNRAASTSAAAAPRPTTPSTAPCGAAERSRERRGARIATRGVGVDGALDDAAEPARHIGANGVQRTAFTPLVRRSQARRSLPMTGYWPVRRKNNRTPML